MSRIRKPFNIKQKSSLSQVFLQDDWPCKKLVELLKRRRVQSVVEVGPGPGILTRLLLKEGIQVIAVEKDVRFAELLKENFKDVIETKQLQVVGQDILRFDLASWIKEQGGLKVGVCGNIPYNISTQILQWLLREVENLSCASLMVQLEFAERVAASVGKKSYGSLSVFTQLRSKTRLDFKVPRTCFHPIPKVDSAVISLEPLLQKTSLEKLKQVEKLCRKAFSQRRKQLSNSLAPLLKDKDLSQIPFDLSRRCETLSPQDFSLLAEHLDLSDAPASSKKTKT